MSLRLRLAEALFEGHFPGHPILPAVAQLALVERALGAPLAALRSVKLRRLVTPGEDLELTLGDPDGEGWTRFELRRDGEAVSTGALLAGEARQARFPPSQAPVFPLGDRLPHEPPARLVLGVAETAPEAITVVAEIPPNHPLAEDGRVPALLGIEAAAQAAAVLESLGRTEGGEPRIGYLVGIREARLQGTIATGAPFRATARLQGSAPPLSIYEITVDGIAEGIISTYATPTPATRGG